MQRLQIGPSNVQVPDTAYGAYYVSCIREGRSADPRNTALVSGPYANHGEALALVDQARRIAEKMDHRAVWYAFGTVRLHHQTKTQGMLQRWGWNLDLTEQDTTRQ